jgi:MSHA biogenesis protein MshN
MLSDIENRQATGGETQPPSGNLYQTRSPQARSYSLIISAGLVTVVVVAGIVIWSQYGNSDTHKGVPQAAPISIVPIANSPALKEAIVETNKPLAASSVAAVDQAPAKKSATPILEKSVASAMTPKTPSNKVMKKEATLSSATSKNSSFKVVNSLQQSDNLYMQAISLIQQSRVDEAQQVLSNALVVNAANHNARQLLASLQADTGNDTEAADLLREGLKLAPKHTGFSVALAHIQFTQGKKEDAIATMEQGLAAAGDDAEYHAFLAGLLQNQGRHGEAIQHYITSLRSNPSMPNWLIGVGVSLQATDQNNDAAAAFQRAIDTGELSSDVMQFAEQQLKVIRPSVQSSK